MLFGPLPPPHRQRRIAGATPVRFPMAGKGAGNPARHAFPLTVPLTKCNPKSPRDLYRACTAPACFQPAICIETA